MMRIKKWKKLTGILLICVFNASCATISLNEKASDQPLVLETDVYDFEYAGPLQRVYHEFEFSNAGKTPVSITGISVCCGCEASLSQSFDEPFKPGEDAKVSVVCTMPRYEGPVEKVIAIHTDLPDLESIPLTLKGLIKRDTLVVPSALLFGNLKRGQTAAKNLRVLQMSHENLSIVKIEADPNFYSVDFNRLNKPNHRGFDVAVKFSANGATGAFSDVITIYTNDEKRAKIDVPVLAQIED